MDDDKFAEQGDRAALDALTGAARAEISALAGRISSPCAYWELPGSSRAAVDQAIWLTGFGSCGGRRPDDDDDQSTLAARLAVTGRPGWGR